VYPDRLDAAPGGQVQGEIDDHAGQDHPGDCHDDEIAPARHRSAIPQ
jgi:hypothetical protein